MKEQLIAYFSKLMPLSQEEAQAIADSSHIESFPKGTILLKEGQVAKECYFVLKGCVRQYYIVEGEEKTTNFYTEEQWVVSSNSFLNQTPAEHYFDCLEDAVLVIGNEAKEKALFEQFPRLETLSRTIMERIFGEQQKRMATYLTNSPEQRYLNVLTERPELMERVPQYQLASYIGVKPESLSRIRKRIFLKR